jgi:hypothetical protein
MLSRVFFALLVWSLAVGLAVAAKSPDVESAHTHFPVDQDAQGDCGGNAMASPGCATACGGAVCISAALPQAAVDRISSPLCRHTGVARVVQARAPDTAPPKRFSA